MSKQCNLKKQPAGTVCNPLTGRWVKIGGPTYNKLVETGKLSKRSVAREAPARRRPRTTQTTEPTQRRATARARPRQTEPIWGSAPNVDPNTLPDGTFMEGSKGGEYMVKSNYGGTKYWMMISK